MDTTIRSLFNTHTVRLRCHKLLEAGLSGQLKYFSVNMDRLSATGDYLVQIMYTNYPNLEIPPFSCWRQLNLAAIDRWGKLTSTKRWTDSIAYTRSCIDFAFISTLLSIEQEETWTYVESLTGETHGPFEGALIAVLSLFERGIFSQNRNDPLRVDASTLLNLKPENLAEGFQVCLSNPLEGVEQMTKKLNLLGAILLNLTDTFKSPDSPRPGNLIDYLKYQEQESLTSSKLLEFLLFYFNSLWGNSQDPPFCFLGDGAYHPYLQSEPVAPGLIMFYNMAQKLIYSLIEPLLCGGIKLLNLNELTGLADTRTGGLFVDMGVITQHPNIVNTSYINKSDRIVEWRALTIALIDCLAKVIYSQLKCPPESLPIPSLMEGGIWSAGRRLSRKKRASGMPPLILR